LYERSKDFLGENGQKADKDLQKKVLAIIQDRLKTLADLPSLSEYFFARPEPNWEMVENDKQLKKLDRKELSELLETATAKFENLEPGNWNSETLQAILNELLAETDSKPMILFSLIRYALTWAPFSPGLPETMNLLGQEETLARLNAAATRRP